MWRIPFGKVEIGDVARRNLEQALQRGHVTEGPLVEEFEKAFAQKFAWKHAVATSSGTDAGMVAWRAVREAMDSQLVIAHSVLTPACAFVATTNCILAAGLRPLFIDVDLDTLNLSRASCEATLANVDDSVIGMQFVSTMGKPSPIDTISDIAKKHELFLLNDACESHGAMLPEHKYADHWADAAIYSFYPAHLVVGVEGGMICTNDDAFADLCRSIKSHGRAPGSTYFDFQRIGFNSKWSDLHAAVALESLEGFDARFARRRFLRRRMIEELAPWEDRLILYRDNDARGEVTAPHAFPIVLRDEDENIEPLYKHLEANGIQCKTLFGSLPTQHAAFRFLGYDAGDFPVAERIGRTGLHFGCNEFMTEEDVPYIGSVFEKFFK